jgi:hypothetical protein
MHEKKNQVQPNFPNRKIVAEMAVPFQLVQLQLSSGTDVYCI